MSLRPHGRSGLKLVSKSPFEIPAPSPPTRAEWIEIFRTAVLDLGMKCLRPHGRSGLKCFCWRSRKLR